MIRTPDQRLRVFVSSALRELAPERVAAREAITHLRLTPVLFELGARPHPPRELYRAYVEQSQVFIGIYWESYGWVAPAEAISGLEDEYRLAESRPRLIYIKRPARQREPRLDALLAEIERDERVTYRYFETVAELRELIENDLAVLLTERFGGLPELPTGTLTLLFTDIEGSTRLLQGLGEAYERVLADHQRIIRGAVAQHGGTEVQHTGDGFFLVFPRARDAVNCAVAAQRALERHPWPPGATIRVRMGVHTGEPALTEGQYVGLDVHRAARIASAGHGGQILLSRTTRDLTAPDLSEGLTLRDLGMHRLRDLQQWEHIFQVLHPDLPADFPPLESLDTLPNNLPRKLTSFIGREAEIAAVKALLAQTTLLTIVGIGGAGKTRLALQVAADLLAEFRHGAWLVELAPVNDGQQILEAVAGALGVREYPGLSLQASLFDYLSTRHLLLVLDNCEHLIAPVAAFVEGLVTATPDVRILCTSRESLGIGGERVWRIPSLALPRGAPGSDPSFVQSEAVRLFAERARTAASAFALTDDNLATIARICVRLDGIPLAIELAAARVRVLSVDQIAERLDDRFRLLAGGSRTALPRQQTLRAAMDWSYDLLTDPERALLRRLSVFAGGWTLPAAEAVCQNHAVSRGEVLDLLTHLVDKSLVDVDGGAEPRYMMLETVREYGRERLVDAAEAPEVHARHRDWYLALAEEAAARLRGPQQKAWLDRLEAEWDNLQGALQWALQGDDPDYGVRLVAALWRFWYLRGHLTTGGEWVTAVLAKSPAPSAALVGVADGAAVLAYTAGDLRRALELAHDLIHLARTVGDARGAASGVLLVSTIHLAQSDVQPAAVEAEESLSAFREAHDRWGQALALSVLGDLAINQGEYEQAVARYEESVALFREVGDTWGIALSRRGAGFAARLKGDYDLAASLQAASLNLARELGDPLGTGYALIQLGFVQWRQGDYARAGPLLRESLEMFREAGNRRGVAEALSVLGLVEEYQGDHDRATQLLEESLALYESIGFRIGVASVLGTLGRVALHRGDLTRAAELAADSVARFREIGDRRGTATSLRLLGEITLSQGELARALRHAQESLALFRDLGDRWAIGYAHRLLGGIALARHEYDQATQRFSESLVLHQEHRDRLGIVKSLEGLTQALIGTGHHERAARLLGAGERLRAEIAAPRTAVEVPVYERSVAQLRAALGAAGVAALVAAGREMTREQVEAAVEVGPAAG